MIINMSIIDWRGVTGVYLNINGAVQILESSFS